MAQPSPRYCPEPVGELDATTARWRNAFDAAADHFDDAPLSFFADIGAATVDRLDFTPGMRGAIDARPRAEVEHVRTACETCIEEHEIRSLATNVVDTLATRPGAATRG